MMRQSRQAGGNSGRGFLGGDPFLILFLIEAAGQIVRMQRLPQISSGVASFAALLHFRDTFAELVGAAGRRGVMPIIDYGLLPMWAWTQPFKTSTWASLTLSPFLHQTFIGLLANMLPFLRYGDMLERAMAPAAYARALAFAVVVPNLFIVALTKLYATTAMAGRQSRAQTAAFTRTLYTGFSGPLFCLSTILNLEVLAPANWRTTIYGWDVPAKYAVWVEIAIHQLLVPGSSIFSHLSGALAGYAYVYGAQALRRVSADRAARARGRAGVGQDSAGVPVRPRSRSWYGSGVSGQRSGAAPVPLSSGPADRSGAAVAGAAGAAGAVLGQVVNRARRAGEQVASGVRGSIAGLTGQTQSTATGTPLAAEGERHQDQVSSVEEMRRLRVERFNRSTTQN